LRTPQKHCFMKKKTLEAASAGEGPFF
jgi:hypothetical protein